MVIDCKRACKEPKGGYPKFSSRSVALKELWGRLLFCLHSLESVLASRETVVVTMDKNIMKYILLRIEQREVYYHVFHNGMELSERKLGALFCYWVLKLMPFRCAGISHSIVNRQVALCAFIRMLYASAERRKLNFCMPSETMDNLKYSFLHHDLSKEALILLADALLRI